MCDRNSKQQFHSLTTILFPFLRLLACAKLELRAATQRLRAKFCLIKRKFELYKSLAYRSLKLCRRIRVAVLFLDMIFTPFHHTVGARKGCSPVSPFCASERNGNIPSMRRMSLFFNLTRRNCDGYIVCVDGSCV